MALNTKQQQAFDNIIKGANMFISGSGGVGKSYLIRHIVEYFGDSTVLLAPTGIAALNIGGATIHSAFKFPFEYIQAHKRKNYHPKTEELFAKDSPVKRIIIDEISMVRIDTIQTMDMNLRKIRRINKPFGGLQVIVVGDFYQLCPVVVNKDKPFLYEEFNTPFAFGGDTWSGSNFIYTELTEPMRHSDAELITNLLNIRERNTNFQESVKWFNKIGTTDLERILDTDPTFLMATNKAADTINQSNYDDIDEPEDDYPAIKTGDFKERPAPYDLKMKYGTRIIIVANTEQTCNGDTGYYLGKVGDKIQVLLERTEQPILLEPFRWENSEYTVSGGKLDSKVVGTYTQFPIRMGWAVTIHKCQGLTLPSGVIDFGRGCFASGQAYVALSRIKTPENLGLLTEIRDSDIIRDAAVVEFYENGCRGIGL